MYFGDYLIKKKVISYDQLLQALCYQLENLPSLIRLVWEAKIINSDELLVMLKSQIQSDSDILTMLKNSKKIDDQKIAEIEMIQMSKKIPLGEVLVKMNYVNVELVNEALREFYDNKFHLEEHSENKIDSKIVASSEVEISDAALESLRELGMSLDSGLSAPEVKQNFEVKPFIDQYSELFTEKYKNKLKKLIEILAKESNGTSDISNYYNSLYRDLHLLKGSITLSELHSQEEIISVWERQIEQVLTKSNDDIRKWCKSNLDLLSQTIDILWDARSKIIKDRTDQGLESDENFVQKIGSILDKIS
jgi:uncharacterized protein involved in tolerance to divalent cations